MFRVAGNGQVTGHSISVLRDDAIEVAKACMVAVDELWLDDLLAVT
jgi:hypothetical protein